MYYISNIDFEIHNLRDVAHIIIDHETWIEASILDNEGGEIESVVVFKNLSDLLYLIEL